MSALKLLHPVEREKRGWLTSVKQHQVLLDIQRPEVVIIGDSIAKGLQRYSDIFKKSFTSTLNLGLGGDRVEHVLWRLFYHKFPSSVKVVVVICGTNNIERNSVQSIAATLEFACVSLLKMKIKPWIAVM